MIIGLVGKKQVGKDTVAQYLVHYYDFIQHAFAAPLKKACQVLFLLESEQLHVNRLKEQEDPRWGKSPRQMMQLVGTDLFRQHVDQDFWVKHMEYWLDKHMTTDTNIVISDVRFQNEADLIRQKGGVLWMIKRDTFEQDVHESETQHIHPIDTTLTNTTSLDDLYTQVNIALYSTHQFSSVSLV
jgi:hypothetical protein